MPLISAARNSDELINLVQIYDARRGIRPAVNPRRLSRWHGMSQHALQNISNQTGWTGGQLTKEELIEYLTENAPSVEDMSEDDARAVLDLLAHDQLSLPKPHHDDHANSYQKTWNHGLTAPENVMRHLQTAVGSGLQPAPTDNTGFLSGVRALSSALRIVQMRVHRRFTPDEIVPLHIRHSDMMDILFENYGEMQDDLDYPDIEPNDDIHGIPTPAYRVILEERYGPMDEMEEDTFNELTSMNNLTITQLFLILQLLVKENLLDRSYALGVVVESHDVVTADGTTQRAPRHAQIIGDYDENTPIVWLYNDGYGMGQSKKHEGRKDVVRKISHWEGFELPLEDTTGVRRVNEWGLSIPDARALPAPRFSKAGRDEETPEQKAERARTAAAHMRNIRAQALRQSCIRCRDENVASCRNERH